MMNAYLLVTRLQMDFHNVGEKSFRIQFMNEVGQMKTG